MKKNKGFTLIELLAVIVILGVLLSISIVAVNKIRKNQEKENEKNVISSILTGAKKYATENNISTNSIKVKDLIDKYVDFDQNKYSYLNLESKNVIISTCDNNLKRKFSIEDVNGTTYNDCGCESQGEDEVFGDKLCTEKNQS